MSKWKCEICNKEFDNFHAQGFDNKIYCPLCFFKEENRRLKSAFCKIYDYLEDNYAYSLSKGTINDTDVDKLYEILNDNLYLLKGDKE